MNCSVLNLLAKCCCPGGMVYQFCVQLTIMALAIIFGALFAWKPKKAIDIQTALYRFFNWKLEPISMEKAIKNTRIMGMTILILGILSFVGISLMLCK